MELESYSIHIRIEPGDLSAEEEEKFLEYLKLCKFNFSVNKRWEFNKKNSWDKSKSC